MYVWDTNILRYFGEGHSTLRLQAEKTLVTQAERASAKAALTELFLETKTAQTPAIVERIVNDIDAIVKFISFDGWQTSLTGEKEVKRELRRTLLKYQLHHDDDLFHRAYEYIKEYY